MQGVLPLYFSYYQRVAIDKNLLYSFFTASITTWPAADFLVSHFLYRNVSTPRRIPGVTATTIPMPWNVFFPSTVQIHHCSSVLDCPGQQLRLYFLVGQVEPKAM